MYSYNTTKAQIITGGNISLNYANGFYLDLSPMIGYKWEKINVGFSPFYAYRQNTSSSDYSFGGRVFSQFYFVENIFLHAEVDASNVSYYNSRKWVYGIPLGAGYQSNISENVGMQISILYDVLLDKNSLKENPEIRGGIIYGF